MEHSVTPLSKVTTMLTTSKGAHSSIPLTQVMPPPTERPLHLSVVMPAHNESATISVALSRLLSLELPCPLEVIVVDDGSTDDTPEQLDAIEDDRLVVHRHPVNLGKGAAVMTGVGKATGTHLLIFDADLEYSALDIPKLVQPVLDGHAQVVFGSRLFGMNTVYQSFRYAVGNRITTLVANIMYDSYISDLHTCLKLVPLPLFRNLVLTEPGFGLDSEITAELLRHRVRPFEVPVSYVSRTHAQGKKIKASDGLRCLSVLCRVRFRRSSLPEVSTPDALSSAVLELSSVVDVRAAEDVARHSAV